MVLKETVYIDTLGCDRTLHIYLPDDLAEGARIPVLYMFDGHNLFYDWDAAYGKSWGIKDYLDRTHTHVLVVGIECNHEGQERLNEFSPYDHNASYGNITQKGQRLIHWMIHGLKPYIDTKYPTIPDREHTYAGGSSMGGLMSLYLALKHSDVYSRVAAVSPSTLFTYPHLREDCQGEILPDTHIYMSWGGREAGNLEHFARVTDKNLQLVRILQKKPGVEVLPHVFKNDSHCEASWEKEMPTWMEELGISNI